MKKPNLSIITISLTSGGAEKVVSLLLKELIKDYTVHLVLFHNHIHFDIPREVNVEILGDDNPNKPLYLKIVDFFKFIVRYSRLIKKYNILYSISFLAFPNLINGIIASVNKIPKTIISERGFPTDNTTSKASFYISKIFYPILYNKCDKLFSNSYFINADLKNNFGVKIPMQVIYNPIEVPKSIVDPLALNKEINSLKLITAGTLNTRKNQIMIIRAIEKSKLSYQLNILGGGPLKSFLYNEVSRRNLNEQVQFSGMVKNVNEHLAKSHIFVLSSFTEGFPNALLEAMSVGLPCISTNCLSGPLELLHDNKTIEINNGEFFKGDYGILINNDDHVALQNALDYFHNNPKERSKYSELGVQRSKKYLLNSVYKELNHFIRN
ncbi:glycosyltransferase [Hyunsoonleella sp. SJ7]|uniref:Glycosyltransferase n=1 Tax=Hyunsoonleella aquatilis TaxID=2762758 RepID=A0A923KMF0_9FLAO|nr:glycosyltransferase [Hyunsoonleella aquatilis]MBC3758990.1 glycosyltransferase [Hyunsoonleella aquatilis]